MKFHNLLMDMNTGTESERAPLSSAELMSDSAIYRRTTRGQRELLRSDGLTASPALRILARLNGYTDLRRLIDLSPGDAREMPAAIKRLFEDGLIEMVDGGLADAPRRSGRR